MGDPCIQAMFQGSSTFFFFQFFLMPFIDIYLLWFAYQQKEKKKSPYFKLSQSTKSIIGFCGC